MPTVLALAAFACGLMLSVAAFVAMRDGRVWAPGSRIDSVDRLHLWSVGNACMAIGALGIGADVLDDGAGPNLLPLWASLLGVVLTNFSGIHRRPWRKRPTV